MVRRARARGCLKFEATVVAVVGSLLALGAGVGSAAAAECPNEALRVEESAPLPDCRAYEQVSPSKKGTNAGFFSSPFFPSPFISLASETRDGSVIFASNEPMPGSVSGTLANLYLSNREGDGWSRRSLAPPVIPLPGQTTVPSYYATSPDLTKSVFQAADPTLAPGAEPNLLNDYLSDSETGGYELLTTGQGPEEGDDVRGFTEFVGASKDFSHVVFDYTSKLLPEAPTGRSIYEFVNGELRLVSVPPNGEPGFQVYPPGGPAGPTVNAVSHDGSRVYFSSLIGGIGGEGLYVRIDGDRTVRINAPQGAEPDETKKPAQFWAASSDGNLSFFSSPVPLTDDANTGRDSEGHNTYTGQNLYMYDLDRVKLTDLSVDTNPLDAETGAEVQGVVGTSEDGSYVYFVALGALEAGATKGSPNLYLWHDGTVKYLATLAPGDYGNWESFVQTITSRVSPDGRHVLLSSAASLTGYDNTDVVTGEPDTELYLYSADSSSFECVSCNPDGSRPRNSTSLFTFSYGASMKPNFMTDDGSRVAFATREGLVSRDTNGQPDIYEFSDGKLALITTGTDDQEARFGELSTDGTDLYFTSFERLTLSDVDDYADLYDARAGGGFVEAKRSVAACSASECSRGTLGPPPLVAGISNFEGPPSRTPAAKPKKPHCGPKRKVVKRRAKYKCVAKSSNKTAHGKHRRGAGSNQGGSK